MKHYYQVKTVIMYNIFSEQMVYILRGSSAKLRKVLRVLYLVDIWKLITAVIRVETFCDGKRYK